MDSSEMQMLLKVQRELHRRTEAARTKRDESDHEDTWHFFNGQIAALQDMNSTLQLLADTQLTASTSHVVATE